MGRLVADGYLVGVGDGIVSVIDPSITSAPIMDSTEAVAAEGGGTVHFPATDTKSASEAIQETGPIYPEDEVEWCLNGEVVVEITGAGNSGLVVDSNQATYTSNGAISSFNIYGGRINFQHTNGATGNTGRGIVLETNLQNSEWNGVIGATGWNGYGFYDNSATYQTNINHIHLTQINPRNEAKNNVAYFANGGAPYTIRYLSAYPYDDGATYARGARFEGGANPHIGTCNFGGPIGRALEPTFTGQHGAEVGHLNYESVDRGQVSILIDHRNDRPFALGSLALYNVSATIDILHYLSGVGLGYYPVPAVSGSITINDVVNVGNDTSTAVNSPTSSIVYEEKSADVNNASGGTLSEPVACLGDLTTVT